MPRKVVTMRHVAAACGVSSAAVSQILRDPEHPRFAARTRERVLATAARLDYRPDRVGQALRSRRTGILGLVTPWAEPELVDSVCSESRAHGFQVFVQPVPEKCAAAEVECLRLMREWRVEGILWLPYTTSDRVAPLVQELSRDGVNVVLLQRGLPNGCAGDAVTADFKAGLCSVLDHVAAQGYREVVYVHKADAFEPRQNRLAWFREMAPERFAGHGVLDAAAADFAEAVQVAAKRPQMALVVDSHWLGIALMRLIDAFRDGLGHAPGMVCLRDMRIGGLFFVNELLTPPITSLELPLKEIGEEGVRLLARRCGSAADGDTSSTGTTARIPMPLHIRGTTPPVGRAAVQRSVLS